MLRVVVRFLPAGDILRVGMHFLPVGDTLCVGGTGIRSPTASDAPGRNDTHPAAWNVPGRDETPRLLPCVSKPRGRCRASPDCAMSNCGRAIETGPQ